jgi:hypothetical protein
MRACAPADLSKYYSTPTVPNFRVYAAASARRRLFLRNRPTIGEMDIFETINDAVPPPTARAVASAVLRTRFTCHTAEQRWSMRSQP